MIPVGRALAVAIAATIVAGCSAPTTRVSPVVAPASAPLPPPRDDAALLHFLHRATFGPRPGDLERVRELGPAAWLERELSRERAPEPALEAALASLPTLSMTIPALLREFPQPDAATRQKMQSGEMSRREVMQLYPPEKRPARIASELQAAKVVRAVLAERQLEEVMVDFWFNHFNVFAPKGAVRWYVTGYERDAIRPHALGRFRDLVTATSRHPAMLYYLDNWLSAREGSAGAAGPNRGRRVGLNENYARELLELHTLGVDGGYTQKDVTEVARAFTGFTIDRPYAEGAFTFRGAMHDQGGKVVLGTRLPALGGAADAGRVIDIVTRHPSTARFIATKLVRRFVADDPPAGLVARVADTFRTTDGDIPALLRVIFSAPEFWDARRAKIKKPFEFVASAVRAVGAQVDASGGLQLARVAAGIGEPLYEAQPPTGHPDRAEAWVSSGALVARMNFALALAQNRYPGVRVDPARMRELSPAGSGAVGDPVTTTALTLGSPEFQRR